MQAGEPIARSPIYQFQPPELGENLLLSTHPAGADMSVRSLSGGVDGTLCTERPQVLQAEVGAWSGRSSGEPAEVCPGHSLRHILDHTALIRRVRVSAPCPHGGPLMLRRHPREHIRHKASRGGCLL